MLYPTIAEYIDGVQHNDGVDLPRVTVGRVFIHIDERQCSRANENSQLASYALLFTDWSSKIRPVESSTTASACRYQSGRRQSCRHQSGRHQSCRHQSAAISLTMIYSLIHNSFFHSDTSFSCITIYSNTCEVDRQVSEWKKARLNWYLPQSTPQKLMQLLRDLSHCLRVEFGTLEG